MAYDLLTGTTKEDELAPTGGDLVFSSTTWNKPQTLTLRCIHDWRDDGNRLSILSVTSTSIGDPAYHNFDLASAGMTAETEIVSVDFDKSDIVVVVGEAALDTIFRPLDTAGTAYQTTIGSTTAPILTTGLAYDDYVNASTTPWTGNGTTAYDPNDGSDEDGASISVQSHNRLETNSSGKSDYVSYVLTSRPYAEVKINLVSPMPEEAELEPAFVTFQPSEGTDIQSGWSQPQLITVTGQASSRGKTAIYDMVQRVDSNDSTYQNLGDDLDLLTVVNDYPLPDIPEELTPEIIEIYYPPVTASVVTVVIAVQEGFQDFGEFLDSDDGNFVWYIVGGVAFVVVALVIGLVAMNFGYRKKIREERQRAIDERAALVAGAEDMDITWNSSDFNRVTAANNKKRAKNRKKLGAISEGIELQEIAVTSKEPDPTENIQRRMGIMVSQMQAHLLKLYGENTVLAQQRMIDPIQVEQSVFQSDDPTMLLDTIKRVKMHNYQIVEGQATRRNGNRRKGRKGKARAENIL